MNHLIKKNKANRLLTVTVSDLTALGIATSRAINIINQINAWQKEMPDTMCWQYIINKLITAEDNFNLHELLYDFIYAERDFKINPAPAWLPDDIVIKNSNIYKTMQQLNLSTYEKFHTWSVSNPQDYWQHVIQQLGIKFDEQYNAILELDSSKGLAQPNWLPNAKLNIINSCFNNNINNKTAILYQDNINNNLQAISYEELDKLSNRIANGITNLCAVGDVIAIALPMTVEAIAIYIAIIKAGCVAVGIADSFSAKEIKARLTISKAKLIFTQDFIIRAGKQHQLYSKVVQADAPKAIVLISNKKLNNQLNIELRSNDISWQQFLPLQDQFNMVTRNPHDHINILFSSGTTGAPKAIAWDHTSAIKAAADGYYHQDIKSQDIIAWPTSLGWMMGPWLIFAAFVNKATIALYYDTPTIREFNQFVQDVKVTILGVVPSLVKTWRQNNCLTGINWSNIRLFSSTGETSNPTDMLFLMAQANYKPIIEYCGGTEIAGAYITATVLHPCVPSTFTTPALGLDIKIIDGEAFIIPPSIGLSRELINKDNYQIYYANIPNSDDKILRRHGDQIERLANGYYRALGRVDDTMNLNGIKVSSAEIERALVNIQEIAEAAAIAISPESHGPNLLVIYVVLSSQIDHSNVNAKQLQISMQHAINKFLNPLFKIHAIEIIQSLPRTSSNKIMRRKLRESYLLN